MRRTLIVAVSALLTLSACDTSGEPSAPPTTEDSLTTATAEPPAPADDTEVTTEPEPEPTSEEPTEETAPAADKTVEGAEAFVETYMEELNDARSTGNTDDVGALATGECASCENFVSTARQGGLNPLEYQVLEAVLLGESATVTADVTDGDQSGQVVFELVQSDAEWRVNAVQAVQ